MPEGRCDANGADLDAVIRDMTVLKDDLARLMTQMKSDTVETIGGEARRLYRSLAADGERSVAAIAQHVEQRPIASLLIAFAVGFVGGRILAK